MRISERFFAKALFPLLSLFLFTSLASAETIEVVTYYPAPGNGGGTDPQFNSLRVGNALAATPTPVDGVVLVATALGIGTTAPNEQLEITGNFRLPPTTVTTGIIFSGPDRLIHSFLGNFFAGTNAGNFTMNGSSNTGVGRETLTANVSGVGNTALGAQGLFSNSTGGYNTAVGMFALYSNTTGSSNASVGSVALYSNTAGGNNTAMGASALYSNTSGVDNTAVGRSALYFNTTGQSNTAVGKDALIQNTTSQYNTAIGTNALQFNTAGQGNTALGSDAGVGSGLLFPNANTTGSYNTFLGYRSSPGTATQLTNATAIGANALVSASNALVLGGTGVNAVNVGIGTANPSSALDINGALTLRGMGAAGQPAVPGVSPADQGRIYYDTAAQDFRASVNGVAYAPLGGIAAADVQIITGPLVGADTLSTAMCPVGFVVVGGGFDNDGASSSGGDQWVRRNRPRADKKGWEAQMRAIGVRAYAVCVRAR